MHSVAINKLSMHACSSWTENMDIYTIVCVDHSDASILIAAIELVMEVFSRLESQPLVLPLFATK